MAYKTNHKALRLGIAADWQYKAYGPMASFHLDHKLRNYVANMVELVVPQAPQKAKTKGKYLHKFAVSPGIQGKSVVFRASDTITLILFFYLSYDGAEPEQIAALHRNFELIVWHLQKETKFRVYLRALNYFLFFWKLEIYQGQGISESLHSRINLCADRHRHLRAEKLFLRLQGRLLRLSHRYMSAFRKERYYTRSFYPLVAAFMFQDFDADIAARAIALELQILRVYHKRFLRYAKRFLRLGFDHWNRDGLIEGLRLVVQGRTTDQRRQVRRSQTRTFRLGKLKRAHLAREGSHCRYLAYNRYGMLSVSISYQFRHVLEERWEDRLGISPLRLFTLQGAAEEYVAEKDRPLFGHEANALETFNRAYTKARWRRQYLSEKNPPRGEALIMRPRHFDLTSGFYSDRSKLPQNSSRLREQAAVLPPTPKGGANLATVGRSQSNTIRTFPLFFHSKLGPPNVDGGVTRQSLLLQESGKAPKRAVYSESLNAITNGATNLNPRIRRRFKRETAPAPVLGKRPTTKQSRKRKAAASRPQRGAKPETPTPKIFSGSDISEVGVSGSDISEVGEVITLRSKTIDPLAREVSPTTTTQDPPFPDYRRVVALQLNYDAEIRAPWIQIRIGHPENSVLRSLQTRYSGKGSVKPPRGQDPNATWILGAKKQVMALLRDCTVWNIRLRPDWKPEELLVWAEEYQRLAGMKAHKKEGSHRSTWLEHIDRWEGVGRKPKS